MTALFADIKGSTELMEELDPEEARSIIDPALKLMIDAAHRFDGYVVQSTGDGIFALFGAPVVNTRNAARLVRKERPDGSPFKVREFMPHDSSLRFERLNHVRMDAFNWQNRPPALPRLRAKRDMTRTCQNRRE